MITDVFKKVFEDSENKNIDIWCDGKLVVQFKRTRTEVTCERNATISIKNLENGNIVYIDTYHVSNVWVSEGKPKDDSPFI